jgi:hypothetical protein
MRRGVIAGLFAAMAMLVLSAAASAAAPANDDFADRQVLEGDLPLTVGGSNLEATKEPEEPLFGPFGIFANGHSVWYEWKATSSGFVTVNTCGSTMRAVLAIFTGTAVNDLTEIAADIGPDCPDFYGEAITFKAISGTTYEIGIDGSSPFPEETHPGQGSLNLELLETPPPANDDFAEAQVLTGEMLDQVYAAGGESYNWNATKEPGEPAHAGDPGGASIWFSWTAPMTANYGISACGMESVLAVYTGDSVDALTPVGASISQCNLMRLDAIEGTTYRLALDGRFDAGAGTAATSAMWINVFREPPSSPPIEEHREPPIVELPGVETTIRKKIVRPKRRSATFFFGSSEADSRFLCTLDKRPTGGCKSPKTYRHLKPGRHVFRVAAEGRTRGWDASAAVASFTIPKPKRQARR